LLELFLTTKEEESLMSQLIGTEYVRANRKLHRKDKLIYIYKDEDGTKHRKVILEPSITYHVTKKEYSEAQDTLYKYIPKEYVRPVKTKFSNLIYSIKKELDDPEINDYIQTAFNSSKPSEYLSRVHLDYRLHGTDINIEDYYTEIFLQDNPYETNNFGLKKLFPDIEVDSSMIKGFPEASRAECPVNAISCVCEDRIYLVALDYPDLKECQELKKNVKSFIQELKDKYKKLLNKDYEITIKWYDSDIELIYDFFNIINYTELPDFVAPWNADYDFIYLVERIKKLGYEPTEIMCREDIPEDEKYVSYKKGNIKDDIADRHSEYNATGYTNYIDEMQLYANITKSKKEESYSLDYIGEKVTGMNKEEVVSDMKNFHFANYKKFLEYNIQDSVLLSQIEEHKRYIDLLYTIGIITKTKVRNALKKTVCLKNHVKQYALNRGYIQSNNRAELYTKLEEKIEGAFVLNTNLMENIGFEIFDNYKSQYIFDMATDEDLKSLYPSIKRALNISLETYIGKIVYNDYDLDGKTLAQDYISGDILNFGIKYFNLPSVDDVLKLLEEEE
jgi:hypothetical protein